jgi:TolB-like protein
VPATGDRLDSWKEIAAYLNRSVRTVRRWERDEGLPVHRHQHKTLASVYAHKSEIDSWRDSARTVRSPRLPTSKTAAGEGKSIVVLPFENLSKDVENEYFADGLTEEVTANLSKVRALRVISRTSSRNFRGSSKNAKSIAAELGVRYLLEGSVRRAGDRLRITAQLVDAVTDDHVWADTYDGTMDDVFAIQERLARVIVEELQLQLTADEQERLGERPIDNVRAYECYLRARFETWRWREDSIDRAIELLNEGLAIVGENARLYAALGLAHLQYREAGIDFSERPLIEAERCARRVFALEGDSHSALQLRGWIHYSRGAVQDAVRDLKAALEIEESNADTLLILSNCCLISGRVPAARPLIARLLAVDPLTPLTRCMPAFADIMEGDFASAIAPYRLMLEMDPSNPMARLFYLWVLLLNGRNRDAAALVKGFPAKTRDTAPARIARFLERAAAGRGREGQASLTPGIEAAATATDLFPRFLAQGFALAEMPELAMHWLEIAIDRGFINYPFLARYDPFFERYRSDSRLKKLLAVARRRWERFEI